MRGGGRSVSEVVSLYVVGIRWPPITPTAQSVHSVPTQYAHASTYVQQLSFKEKTSIAGAYSVQQCFLEVDKRSLQNLNHMQMMILVGPRY